MLKALSAGKRMEFYQRQIGKKLDVVIVSKHEDDWGHFRGMSDNYVPVHVTGHTMQYREIYPVTVTSVNEGKVYATHT